jgi:hypothetical protein
MFKLIAIFLIFVVVVTAGAVIYGSDRGAMYDSQTAVAQAETAGIVAQAESQSQIAGYEASVDVAAITAQLEIARLQFETTRLANLIESEKIQAMMAQTNAMLTQSAIDLEAAKAQRQQMWMLLIVPSMAAIVVVVVALVVLVAVLRRPVAAPNYPRITVSRDIVPVHPNVTGIVLSTRVNKKQHADYCEVSR